MSRSVDVTELVDRLPPKRWRCPHCGAVRDMGLHAEEIIMEHFKYIEQCGRCGYLHCWELTLTDDFKREVVRQLMEAIT